jgi:4-hydroxybenzoate polyprenyltransferase
MEIRPKQWVKNFLVLAPLIFSLHLFDQIAVVRAGVMFVLFCLISSSVYLLNDILDYEQDRLHPVKQHRPIASGDISMTSGFVFMIALLLIALGGAIVLSFQAFLVLLVYWLINLLYSSGLKHQVLLDVFALASGFVLRVMGGAVAINVAISPWLLLCTLLLALFLGFGKRRYELVLLGDRASEHRQVLSEYNILFLDMMIAVLTACTVMSYALYTVSEVTVRQFNTEGLLLTLPFVLFGIFRYLYLVYHKQRGGDPTQTLLSDPQVVLTLFLWGVAVGIIIY